MKFLIHLLVACVTLTQANGKKICYNDLGCFTNSYPFGDTLERPISDLPETPAKINTTFFLYTRENPSLELISATSLGRNFDPTRPTKIISHGWYDSSFEDWIINMKDAFLELGDFNVIAVDWSGGSGWPYQLAVANTQVVGAETAKLMHALIDSRNATGRDFHLVGHSLGAHVCGYAGKRVKGIPRITGLDPAGPYYENTPPIVRLYTGDADFVDIIHTFGHKFIDHSFFSIGMLQEIGHVDFYPNGGQQQPGCELFSTCSHTASHTYFIDSIRNVCSFRAYPCTSKSDYDSGKCLTCSPKGCNRMGYWCSPDRDLKKLYLNTQSVQDKYKCMQEYRVTMHSGDNGFRKAKGKFEISFHTHSETSSIEVLDNDSTILYANTTMEALVSLSKPIQSSAISGASVVYHRNWDMAEYTGEWSFKEIKVFSADDQSTLSLCPTKRFFTFEHTNKYTKCI